MDRIRVRKAKKQDIIEVAELHVKIWEEVYRGVLDDEFLDKITVGERNKQWRKFLENKGERELFLAEVRKQNKAKIAGFVACGPARDENFEQNFPGEIYTIYVDKKYWRQGIGSELFSLAKNFLQKKGLFPFYLWVLKELTDSRKFYESMGGEIAAEEITKIGRYEHEDLIYAWEGREDYE